MLTGPFKFTHRARIILMQGIIEGVETYFEICWKCDNFYRYQEFADGIHNFDDSFLLGRDVCIFLRESTRNHVAVGTICGTLEGIWSLKVDMHKVLSAYTYFEALSDRTYQFNCVMCGYHPPILIADLNCKVVFKYQSVDEELPNQGDEDADYVNCEQFWEKVTSSVLGKGFLGRKVEVLSLEPRLNFWSPYIGPRTRAGEYVVNSEYNKINKDSCEAEPDCREITQERLLEHILESKTPEIQKLARKVNVSARGSKLDIINRIKDALGRKNDKVNKIFKKIFGCSGGWLTVACRHGIIYAVKFLLRAESLRDYIDILRSMKFKPNILICDTAHIVADHGNRTEPEFFKPFNGRVAESTPENIRSALTGTFEVLLPWLNNNETCNSMPPS